MSTLSLDYALTPGQLVRILSGPFANQQAMVAKVSDDWGSVWVMDKGERVELITQLANVSPVFATQQADSAQRGEEARAEHGTNTGRPAGRNGVAGPDEPAEPEPDDVIQSPPT